MTVVNLVLPSAVAAANAPSYNLVQRLTIVVAAVIVVLVGWWGYRRIRRLPHGTAKRVVTRRAGPVLAAMFAGEALLLSAVAAPLLGAVAVTLLH